NAFILLLRDGADFQRVDKLMEKFGWPMGPAYLLDVVGLDTAAHVSKVMAEGYPDRMSFQEKTVMDVIYEHKRFGQKNGVGFYEYETDKKGKPVKKVNPSVYDILKPIVKDEVQLSDDDIVDRMMLAMIIESAR